MSFQSSFYFKLVGAAVVAAATGFLLYQYQDVFISDDTTLENLVIQGHRYLDKTEILNLIDIQTGSSIGDINASELAKILELHPRIDNASVKLEFPSTLSIHISERLASAVLQTKQGLYEVDSEFNVLSENDVKDDKLLVIAVPFDIVDRRYNGPMKGKVLKLIENLTRLRKNFTVIFSWVSQFTMTSKGQLSAFTVGRPMKVYFGLDITALKLRKLHAAMAYFIKNNLTPKELDLSGVDAVF